MTRMKNIVIHLLAFSLKMIVSHIFEVHKLKKTAILFMSKKCRNTMFRQSE